MTAPASEIQIVRKLRRGPVWSDGEPIGAVVGELNGALMAEAAALIEELVVALEPLADRRARHAVHKYALTVLAKARRQ